MATSKDEMSRVTGAATDRARELANDARSELRCQAATQTAKLADSLSAVANELRSMADRADDPNGPAANAAREAGSRAAAFAGKLDQQGLDGIVGDLERFARNRPGMFLLGAAAAGFAAGRVLRNSDTRALVDAAKPSSDGQDPSQSAPTEFAAPGAPRIDVPRAPLAMAPTAERPLRAPGS